MSARCRKRQHDDPGETPMPSKRMRAGENPAHARSKFRKRRRLRRPRLARILAPPSGQTCRLHTYASLKEPGDINLRELTDIGRHGPPISIREEREQRQNRKMEAVFKRLVRCDTCFRDSYCCRNMPCGHLSNCRDCKQQMIRCSRCSYPIRWTEMVDPPTWDGALRFCY